MVEYFVLRGVNDKGEVKYYTGTQPIRMTDDLTNAMTINNLIGARERAVSLNRHNHIPGYRFIAIPLNSDSDPR